jgi:5'-methylthioadenosine phosphorylase
MKKERGTQEWNQAVLVCTEEPRFETPAEIEMLKRLGCDVVGMTVTPETVFARELETCYAAICFVSNMVAGIQQRLTAQEVPKWLKSKCLLLSKS